MIILLRIVIKGRTMKFNALVPELYVVNFEKSLNFYTMILEFKIEYSREKPKFAFLSYGASQLMIQEEDDNETWHNGKPEYPFGRGINFQIKTTDVQHLLNKLKEAHYPIKMDLKEHSYQANKNCYTYKEFLVMDPDGYLLRFSQPLI